MGSALKYCESCGMRVEDADLQSGAAIEVLDRTYCPRCRAVYVEQMTGGAAPAPAAPRAKAPTTVVTRSRARRRSDSAAAPPREPAPGGGLPPALLAVGVVLLLFVVGAFVLVLRGYAPRWVGGPAPVAPPPPLPTAAERLATAMEALATHWTDAVDSSIALDSLRAGHDQALALAAEAERGGQLIARASRMRTLAAQLAERAATLHREQLTGELQRLEARADWAACARKAVAIPAWLARTQVYAEPLPRATEYARWARGEVRTGEPPWIAARVDHALADGRPVPRSAWRAGASWQLGEQIAGRGATGAAGTLQLGAGDWRDLALAFDLRVARGALELTLRGERIRIDGCLPDVWYQVYVGLTGADLVHAVRRLDSGAPLAPAAHRALAATSGAITLHAPSGTELVLRNARVRGTAVPTVDADGWTPLMRSEAGIERLQGSGRIVFEGDVLRLVSTLIIAPRTRRMSEYEWQFRVRRLRGTLGLHFRVGDALPPGGYLLLTPSEWGRLTTDRWVTLTVRLAGGLLAVTMDGEPMAFPSGHTVVRFHHRETDGRPAFKVLDGTVEISQMRIRRPDVRH